MLFLEQYQQRKDLSRYDLYNVRPNFSESYSGDQGALHMAANGFAFMKLDMDEELFEGRRSIKYACVTCLLYLLCIAPTSVFYCQTGQEMLL